MVHEVIQMVFNISDTDESKVVATSEATQPHRRHKVLR
jgi:hypothetical protein